MRPYLSSFIAMILLISPMLGSSKESIEGTDHLYRQKYIQLKAALTISGDTIPEDVLLQTIGSFTFTPDGVLFVPDMGRHNIKMFAPDGKYIKTIGQRGAGPGDLYSPASTVFNGKYLVVWEIGNRRFSLLTREGKFLRTIKLKTFLMLLKMKTLPNGFSLVETEKIKFGQNIGQECVITLYNQEFEKKQVVYNHPILTNKFIRKPVNTNIPQPFQPRVSWDVLSSGLVVIGFEGKYHLNIYDPLKGLIKSYKHTTIPIPVTEKDQKDFLAKSVYMDETGWTKKGAADYVIKNTYFPRNKPLFNRILTDPNDNILVFLNNSLGTDGSYLVDVFKKNGSFINRVKIRGGKIGYMAQFSPDGYLWTILKDEEDEYQIAKYSLLSHK